MGIPSLLRKIFMVDLLQGLKVTFLYQDPKEIYTEQYPLQRPQVAERYRGAPRLNVNPDTDETMCIACDLCALACPENLIVVSTPQSGWFRCAAERGPGIALFLGLARWASKRTSGSSFLFVSTSGHELGALGMRVFHDELAPRPERVLCWIHLGAGIATFKWEDGPTGLKRLQEPDSGRSLMCSKDLAATLKAVISQRLVKNVKGARSAAVEVLLNTRYTAELIDKGEISEIKDAMEKSMTPGSQTFEQSLFKMYKDGVISKDEALGNADSATNLMWMMNQASFCSGMDSAGTTACDVPMRSFMASSGPSGAEG